MKAIQGIFFIALLSGIMSCGNEEKQAAIPPTAPQKEPRELFLDQVKIFEAKMHKSVELDPVIAEAALRAYADFIRNFPNDSLSPDFIYKSGEIETATQQYKQALAAYETITSKYPGFKLAPESLYLQGYLLDNFLNDDVKAKAVYEQVIAKYPDLPYAADARAAIKNLGKSDEELIREFEKKNKGKK
jgi:outer membrane protein assembly factor BamD (BamD/ComL family)